VALNRPGSLSLVRTYLLVLTLAVVLVAGAGVAVLLARDEPCIRISTEPVTQGGYVLTPSKIAVDGEVCR
jgi:hypothetical protein